MKILLSGAISTVLGALKMFLPSIAADAGIPQEDQAAVVTLADNVIAYIQNAEPLEKEFTDDCDSFVTILRNIKAKSNPIVSLVLAFVIGGLEGMKGEILSAIPASPVQPA